MYLTKETIKIVADSTLTVSEYTCAVNGLLCAIRYRPSTGIDDALSSTSLLRIGPEDSTTMFFWNAQIGSTNSWRRAPAGPQHTNANVLIGETTNYATHHYAIADERVKVSVIGSSDGTQGLFGYFDFYIEGSGAS